MEEIKFYDVKVGTRTRAGNLNIIHQFVAKSSKNQIDVNTFYRNKYKGLAVDAYEVVEIVTDDIPSVKVEYNYEVITAEEMKIRQLEDQIEKLKNTSFDRFEGTVAWNGMTPEITLLINEAKDISENYRNKKEIITKNITSFIREQYKHTVDVNYISIGEYTHNTKQIPFTVKLDGKIKPTGNEL